MSSPVDGIMMFVPQFLGFLWLFLACTKSPADSTEDTAASPTCEEPFSGINRFSEEAIPRGITEAMLSPMDVTGRHMGGRGGGVVVQDMDADGDLDVVIMKFDDGPWIYANDGEGYFVLVPHAMDAGLQERQGISAVAAVDLNGDFLPEILQVAPGLLQVFWNQGAMEFSQADVQISEAEEVAQKYFTLALGDLDGDGDLDMVLPAFGLGTESESDFFTGGPDRILLLEGQTFHHVQDLVVGEVGSRTMVVTLTDRDLDGDLDLFVPSDLGPPTSFWRNDENHVDGVPRFVNDADEIGADLTIHAMGVDAADLNQDGLLDYCISDIGLPKCLLSTQTGYVEGASSMGVASEHLTETWGTIGWSLDLADLDNDGRLDMVQASGPDDGAIGTNDLDFADLFWQGTEDGGFTEVTTETGFGDLSWNHGLATADLDGDGWLDMVVAGPGRVPSLWMNRCGEASWLEVKLVGPGLNTEALGARVEVLSGGRSRIREVSGLRAAGQTPSRLHFGLGDTRRIDRVRVYWPDGEVTELEEVSPSQLLTVHHPQAAQAPWL